MEDSLSILEQWYERYGEAVHRRCQRLLGDQASARDSTQEVFVRAFRALASYRGDGSALSFLLTIADRHCFRELRKRRREEVGLPATLTTGSGTLDIQQAFANDDLVRRLLARADNETQVIVVWRFFDEREFEEIAEKLGISRKTVHRKLDRFYASARKLLAAWQSGRKA